MNFGTPVPLLIGIILILGALALFFLERFKPGYERPSDKVYAILLMISGLFLLAHLDMELLASFQQLLMAGMLTTLLIDSIRSRFARPEPIDERPPRPSYERPPVGRRVYRAELDDRRMPLRDRPATPRMNPMQDDYYPDDFNNQRRRRQPYEEYGAPAGRLQPSPTDRRPTARAQSGAPYPEERYGQRPPARPPAGPSAANYPGSGGYDDRSMSRPDEGREENRASRGSNGYDDRSQDDYSRGNESSGSAERSSRENRERSANSDRTLDVRPYSEAPKLDIPEAPYS